MEDLNKKIMNENDALNTENGEAKEEELEARSKQILFDAKNAISRDIWIDQIDANRLNTFQITEIDELAGSILTYGLMTPISVIGPNKKGKYTIISGERRYRAILTLRDSGLDLYDMVPCYIMREEMDILDQQLAIEIANLETRDFDKTGHRIQVINLLKKMSDAGKINPSDIVKRASKDMHISDRYARMYLQTFGKGIEEVQKAATDKKITINESSRIAALPEDVQKEAVDKINKGEKAKDVIDKLTGNDKTKSKSKVSSGLTFESILDIDDDDEWGADHGSNIDLNLDTSNLFKQLSSDDDKNVLSEKEEERALAVIKWCGYMKQKQRYTETELEAIDSCRSLIEYVDDKDTM